MIEEAVTSVDEERISTFSATCWLETDISLIELETSSTVEKSFSICEAISSMVAPSSRVAEELASADSTSEPVLSAMPEMLSSIPCRAWNDSSSDCDC